jgi:hypothetical protein
MLCKLARSDVGPTFSTLSKLGNIMGACAFEMDLKSKEKTVESSEPVDKWTIAQYETLCEIDKQDLALMKGLTPFM